MSKGDKAVELFKTGLNCSQAVFCAFAEDFGMDFATAKKVSCGLGGGVGRMREVCGTVTGAAMALSMAVGEGDKMETYPIVQEFCEEFKRGNGSMVCRELLEGGGAGRNTRFPVEVGGQAAPRTAEYYKKRPCVELCRYSADLVERLLKIEEVAKTLNNGGTAIIPTDTVYGLAAKDEAIAKLYEIKGRDPNKPIAYLVSDSSMLEGKAKELADKYWPGALTIVYKGEGYRMPDDFTALAIIKRCGGKLRVTSANKSGEPPATDGWAGPSKGGTASTVVKVEGEEVKVLREGPIKL